MRKIKLFKPYVSWYAVWNAVKTLRSGQLAEGPRVKEFEKKFGEKFNTEHVCSLNSGTTALELAYELAGINEGDEVITPILTCTATNIPLVRRKAKIVFADIENDLNISVSDVEKKITPKTKVIVFVHFGGNNRGLKELVELAKRKNILLIEDAAQAVGSDYWGKADFTCVSLQAIKILTSGDGGILICKDVELDKKARRLRWFGYDRDLKQKQGDADLVEAGYKYHMNDVNAAIALGNLKVIDSLITHRKGLIEEYRKHGIDAHIWFATVFTTKRDELKKYLAENGIESGVYHYRNDKYTIFGGKKSFPNMDRLENEYLVLPLHHDVSVNDVRRIAYVIDTFNSLNNS
ncbi:MAG: DegT/DnrJ/EryC1/StrS family aminotransferase [Patescibacteria group bacterium]|nr:DegT/DnrJ/EryC1/StrS family aminotransferase [bacterium]MDZ4240740.1 DegT/DnrJ/EryC1/StrS family aminotransferase [Patescibacteria group bacterium]